MIYFLVNVDYFELYFFEFNVVWKSLEFNLFVGCFLNLFLVLNLMFFICVDV